MLDNNNLVSEFVSRKMANLNHTKGRKARFDKDTYETSHETLDAVLKHLDPSKHYIFEPFPGTGYSTDYMRQCGFIVTNGDFKDFFQHERKPQAPLGVANRIMYVVTNPPFSKKRDILEKLKELKIDNLALLMPSSTISNKYWRDFFPQNNLQIIVNTGRCKFIHPETHIPISGSCSFTVTWFLHNFNLSHDITYFPS